MPATLQLPALRLPLNLPAAWRPRALRGLAFALLMLAVIGSHQALLRGLAGWLARPAAPGPAVAGRAVSVRLVAPPDLAAADPSPAPQVVPAPAAPHGRASRAPMRLPPSAADTALAGPGPAPAPAPAPDPAPLPAAPDPVLADGGPAAAPPTYPTRPPPPAQLHFNVIRGADQGRAEWLWQHDGQHFASRWQAQVAGRPPLDQRSHGSFDAAGLAPARMVEMQRGRPARAVNFQRDKAVVSFSGSTRQWALWAGAQDRVSWLPQLLAVVAARDAGGKPGDRLQLAVAGPRGDLDLWTFTLVDRATPDDEGVTGPALHWVREPQRPYDSRVDVWLAQAWPHWPLALQWQVLPGEQTFRWRLASAPLPAPALAAEAPAAPDRTP